MSFGYLYFRSAPRNRSPLFRCSIARWAGPPGWLPGPARSQGGALPLLKGPAPLNEGADEMTHFEKENKSLCFNTHINYIL